MVIHSRWVSFSSSTMESYHHHHFYCFFITFLCFLFQEEFYHSLGSLITFELHVLAIILLIYINFFSTSTMVSYHHHRCWLLLFFIFRCFIAIDDYDHLLVSLIRLEVLCWEIILALFIMFFFSQDNGVVSPSLLVLVIVCNLSLFTPYVWVWPLVFVVFIFLLFADECYHSIWSLIIYEVLCWGIILELCTLIGYITWCWNIYYFYSIAMATYHRCHSFCFLCSDIINHYFSIIMAIWIYF